jgi:hypothetical protein
VDVSVDDWSDARVADPRQAVDFTLESGPRLVVVGNMRSEHLDRHCATVGVEREVDDPHSALADPLDQTIGPESLGEPLGGRDEVIVAVASIGSLSAHNVIVGR